MTSRTAMLSVKGKYGLKAMIHLARCEPGVPELVRRIAQQNLISKSFLDAILGELREAGLVESKKGRGGGYRLTRPAAEIMLGEVVRVLEGPLAPFRCASEANGKPCLDCPDAEACAVRRAMLQVRDATALVLDQIALSDMKSGAALEHEEA